MTAKQKERYADTCRTIIKRNGYCVGIACQECPFDSCLGARDLVQKAKKWLSQNVTKRSTPVVKTCRRVEEAIVALKKELDKPYYNDPDKNSYYSIALNTFFEDIGHSEIKCWF